MVALLLKNLMEKNIKQKGSVHILANPYVVLFILAILLLLIMFNEKMGNDEGRWSYMGRVWCENNLPPYVGAVENKSPGIFELHALSYLLFGVNYLFVRLLGVVAILISSVTVYRIGKELHSHLAGIFGMIVFGLSMTWHQLNGAYTAQTETFMVLFSTLSFFSLMKGRESQKWIYWVLLSGFSMGLAIAFKQMALITSLGLIIFFLVYAGPGLTCMNKILGVILLGIGIFTSTMFSLIPLFFSGVSLADYVDGAWLILLNPGSSASLTEHIHHFFRIWFASRMLTFYPFLFLIFLQFDLLRRKYFIGLMIWMLLDFIGVNGSGYYFGHQIKQFVPSVSIIIGVLMSNLLANRISEIAVRSRYTAIVIVSLIILLFPYGYIFDNRFTAGNGISDTNREIGRWLEEHSNAEDYVYIADTRGNTILSYSHRVSSSKYFNTTFVTSVADKQQLLSDLEAKPPLYYLRPHSSEFIGGGIGRYIVNNYTVLQSRSGYEIYIRNPN